MTVLEAVHATRVLGHVAADGAGDLAARVGRIEQAVRCRRFADGQIAHAALHDGRARARVDRDNAVELGQAQRHAHRVRQGAARQARARAPRHHRHAQAVAGAQHVGHLRFAFGQGDDERRFAVGGEAVALVRHGIFALPEQRVRGQHDGERGHHRVAARAALGGGGRRDRGRRQRRVHGVNACCWRGSGERRSCAARRAFSASPSRHRTTASSRCPLASSRRRWRRPSSRSSRVA